MSALKEKQKEGREVDTSRPFTHLYWADHIAGEPPVDRDDPARRYCVRGMPPTEPPHDKAIFKNPPAEYEVCVVCYEMFERHKALVKKAMYF